MQNFSGSNTPVSKSPVPTGSLQSVLKDKQRTALEYARLALLEEQASASSSISGRSASRGASLATSQGGGKQVSINEDGKGGIAASSLEQAAAQQGSVAGNAEGGVSAAHLNTVRPVVSSGNASTTTPIAINPIDNPIVLPIIEMGDDASTMPIGGGDYNWEWVRVPGDQITLPVIERDRLRDEFKDRWVWIDPILGSGDNEGNNPIPAEGDDSAIFPIPADGGGDSPYPEITPIDVDPIDTGISEPIVLEPVCSDSAGKETACAPSSGGKDEYTEYMKTATTPSPAYTYRSVTGKGQTHDKCVGSLDACIQSEDLWQFAVKEAQSQLPHNYCKMYPQDDICQPQ